MLGRALKMAFWVTYDHVGKLILANIVWFLGVAVPAAAGWAALGVSPAVALLLFAVSLGVVHPALTVGIAHMVKTLIETRDGSLGDMFRGIRLYGRRAAAIGLLYLLGIVSLTTSMWFYAAKLRDSLPWLGFGLSALAAWALVFALLTALMVVPALVQKKAGALATVKLAAALVLANPFFALGLAAQVLGFTVVSVVFTPLVPLLYGSAVVVLITSAYEMLARKYAADEAPSDEDDDYLNRGFRDFLFPWKG